MYFSRKMQRNLIRKIREENCRVYDLRLRTGVSSEDGQELKSVIDTMFRAWRKIVCSRSRGIIRRFSGIMRRLFIEWSEARSGWEPYFQLICVQKQNLLQEDEEYKLRLEEETLRLSAYIKWLSAWVTALKLCTDVSVEFSVLSSGQIEEAVSDFCTNEKFLPAQSVDGTQADILARVCSGHHLVSFHGMFRELNRHVSVGR